jgi:uncharacterized protein YdcH (DUF465 family)
MSVDITTHRAVKTLPIDSAWHLKNEGEPLMEMNPQDELKAHLMATSEEFRALAAQHAQYHKQLEELEAKSHLTEQEQVEEVRLKKHKLHLKDQMNAVLARYKQQHVA